MGNAPLISECSSGRTLVKKGYVIKRSVRKKGNNWKRRYLRLYNDGTLDTLGSENDTNVKRRIQMEKTSKVKKVWDHAITRGEGYVWLLENPDGFEVCYRCLQEEIRSDWIDCVRNTIENLVPRATESKIGNFSGKASSIDSVCTNSSDIIDSSDDHGGGELHGSDIALTLE